jgi:hypothetical protein
MSEAIASYVARAYGSCQSAAEQDEMEKALKQVIRQAKDNGTMASRNWNSFPIPLISRGSGGGGTAHAHQPPPPPPPTRQKPVGKMSKKELKKEQKRLRQEQAAQKRKAKLNSALSSKKRTKDLAFASDSMSEKRAARFGDLQKPKKSKSSNKFFSDANELQVGSNVFSNFFFLFFVSDVFPLSSLHSIWEMVVWIWNRCEWWERVRCWRRNICD